MATMTADMLVERMRAIPDFIIGKIIDILDAYDKESTTAEGLAFGHCPKCGIVHPRVIKGGRTSTGKQMYRCMECHRRFTADHGTYSFYSHQSPEAWGEMIKMTLAGSTLEAVSQALDINIATAFRMRHKLMYSLEEEAVTTVIAEQAELDEKYVLKSHKGTKLEHVPGKKRGTRASKRGISNEQVCLLTGVQRGGGSYLRSFNMGRPSADEVMNLLPHIEERTYIWTDACASYNKLIKKLGSDSKVVSGKKDYDKVNHLNNVNNFHSMVERWYRDMGGVASKYINRYAALFNLRYQIGKMDPSEALLLVRSRLRGIGTNTFVTIEELKQQNLFDPPELTWGEGKTA
jgi:transposase-like protein